MSDPRQKAAWAGRFMPVCDALIERVAGRIGQNRITVSLEPTPAVLALCAKLHEAGLDVCMSKLPERNPTSPTCGPAPGMQLRGPQDGPAEMAGTIETQDALNPDVAQVNVSASPLFSFAKADLGTGQAAVMAFVDITNLQLAGRPVSVIGFDPMSESVARAARALGAIVTIETQDKVAALRAVHTGFRAAVETSSIASAQVVFCSSPGSVGQVLANVEALKPGAFICNTGDPDGARSAQELGEGQKLRDHVSSHIVEAGAAIRLIAGGAPVQSTAGQGLPIEVEDILLACHLAGLAQLCAEGAPQSGCHPLDPAWEQAIAGAGLEAIASSPKAKG